MINYALLLLMLMPGFAAGQLWYKIPGGSSTGWSSFENPNSLPGKGGQTNKTAKGNAFEIVQPGEKKILLDAGGAGIIQRIWITVSNRSPRMLRSVRIDMYWDGAAEPAVSAPLGDFFGIGLGRTARFENELFSNPEGRSFNCYVPMPYKTGARVVFTNESTEPFMLFYDIDFTRLSKPDPEALYFHAHWTKNTGTKLGEDFNVLPQVKGRGRYLGANLGVIADSVYRTSWWGEGEVKIYIDNDQSLPTLAGTGTEDYIGTGWGQGVYAHRFQGCLVADSAARQWAFYRYHIPDPVIFRSACRVTIQQMGGDGTEQVRQMAASGARLIPVTVATEKKFYRLLDMNPTPALTDKNFPEGWTNFYRLDNYTATAYFYLDKPVNGLPALAPLSERLDGIR